MVPTGESAAPSYLPTGLQEAGNRVTSNQTKSQIQPKLLKNSEVWAVLAAPRL